MEQSKQIAEYLALASEQQNAPEQMIAVAEEENMSVLGGIMRAGVEGEPPAVGSRHPIADHEQDQGPESRRAHAQSGAAHTRPFAWTSTLPVSASRILSVSCGPRPHP